MTQLAEALIGWLAIMAMVAAGVAVLFVGGVAAWAVRVRRRERHLRRRMLVEMEAINSISTAAVQSLELKEVLDRSLEKTAQAMGVEMAWVYLLDEGRQELHFGGQYGLSEELETGIDRLRLGEGLNGRVAQTGQLISLENISIDPRLTREIVRQRGMRGFMAVPLRAKGIIIGTLAIATYAVRKFPPDEEQLLATIGNQIGVIVENARLYQEALAHAAQLRASEEAYRTLFENASDAIVLFDLAGSFLAANRSFQRLAGYAPGELAGLKVGDLFPDSIAPPVGGGEGEGEPWETRLLTRDGGERAVELAAGPITERGEPMGVQYIVRDITERQRMQDNMRTYLEQVTRAQEAERMRLALELHDETLQSLTLVSRRLGELAEFQGRVPRGLRQGLEDTREMAEATLRGMRRTVQGLRPSTLDHLGLVPALRGLVSDLLAEGSIEARIELAGQGRRLSPEVELLLFRIAQEALNNVRRYSAASEATIRVEFGEGEIALSIRDNGRGFVMPERVGDLATEGKLGVLGMYERARLMGGTLSIWSEPGRGTEVEVRVPSAST